MFFLKQVNENILMRSNYHILWEVTIIFDLYLKTVLQIFITCMILNCEYTNRYIGNKVVEYGVLAKGIWVWIMNQVYRL